MKATYAKLRDGSWGVRVTGGVPAAGTALTVRKKSGETKSETIARVLWTGDGVALCAIEPSSRSTSRGQDSWDRRRNTYRRRYGWDGVEGSPSYYSSGLYDEES